MRTSLISLVLLSASLSFAAAVVPSPPSKVAFDRGEKALSESRFEEAAAAYQESLKLTPGFAGALNGLGSAQFKLNKREEALANFKAATVADPTLGLAFYNLGYAMRKTGDYTGAVVAYEKYTALDPNEPDGFYGLAESYKALNQNDKAIAAYESYLKKEKRESEQKYVDRAKESIASLKAAAPAPVAAAPAPAPVIATQAPVAAAPAPVTAAPAPAAPMGGGAALSPVAARKVTEGDKFMSEKKYREASFAYQDSVNADPNNIEALFKLGNSYAVLGYYSQAIDQWQKVTTLTSDPATKKSAQDNVARAQTKMAQVGGGSPAEQNKAPGTGPVADSTRTQARQYYEQGVQLITARRYGEALNYLNECLKLEPALAVGYIARGSTLIGLRRFAEAAVDYQYSLKLDPSLSAPLYGLAEAYRGLSRVDDAKGYYQKYVASNATDVRPELQTDARTKLGQLK